MANTFRATDGRVVDLADVRSSSQGPEFEMGTTIRGTNGSKWTYVKAASATPRYTVQRLLTFTTGSFEVAQGAASMRQNTPLYVTNSSMDSGAFGWVQSEGRCLIICTGSISLPGAVFAAASGVLTNTTTTIDFVHGVILTSGAAGTINAFINNPYVGFWVQNA